jgi:oligopeptide/dipeptide ABC transporter ATP-binding protein
MPSPTPQQLLSVDRLVVDFPGPTRFRVLEDISFAMEYGTSLVILGESGSGKTVLSRSLTGLFPSHMKPVIEGSVTLGGKEVRAADKEDLQRIRTTEVRYVFQDPMLALNPVAKVKVQLRLAARGQAPGERVLETAMTDVGLTRDTLDMFPHQLSVGMAQRVAIAMAIIASPKLLIADEPTSALDVALRLQVMDMISTLCRTKNIGMLLITHDLGVARRYGNTVILLHRGQIVEIAPGDDFFSRPLHPYGQLLRNLQRAPVTIDDRNGPGPEHDAPWVGCRFSNQCPHAKDRCRVEEPMLEEASDGRKVRCFYWK